MVDLYYKTGRPGTANALLGMVGANLVFQLLVVYSKCHSIKKNKWRTMLFEVLSIVTFSKPGVDAYRVASGAETAEGSTMDPLGEMVYTKGGELVFEAVPGLVLQLVAALNAKENTISVYYVIGDYGLYFAYLVARRDLVFFIPMPTAASYATSTVFRAMFKVITDFTGSPIFRLPMFCGGSYYAFCLASSQASVFAAVYAYINYATPPEGVELIAASTLWAGASLLAGAWLCAFLFFALRIAVPKYRYTMWSLTSGRQCVQDYFLRGESDEAKFYTFGCNLLLWESDIGNEVNAWTRANWARWSEEKPAWFKPEQVPDQFIPAAELEQLGHDRKRRGSAAGSIRESFREKDEN
ncbi:hypothetical protein TeGR_g2903 [Tetraparma gracilis]|uniref:Uncharacterized protein n=1 Tax=Tetraparma gracilis TaxID=2962635 RepID=A0ABQ6NB70_9STRA|nr:hypothetical protein TeGR_g2903 [Tetraparma gracilis]